MKKLHLELEYEIGKNKLIVGVTKEAKIKDFFDALDMAKDQFVGFLKQKNIKIGGEGFENLTIEKLKRMEDYEGNSVN